MLTYHYPLLYEFSFKFPPLLLWRKMGLKIVKQQLSSLNITPQEILDFGCGTGVLIPILKKLFPKAKIIGVDKSKEMIRVAKRKYKTIIFKEMDFLQYEGSPQLIVSFYSFQFLPIKEGVEKVKKLLPKGGVAVILSTQKSWFSVLHQKISIVWGNRFVLYKGKDLAKLFGKGSRLSYINETEGSYLLTYIKP
jgi:ubiquinone/menaquinone biosynthesis C-methylase UbiE